MLSGLIFVCYLQLYYLMLIGCPLCERLLNDTLIYKWKLSSCSININFFLKFFLYWSKVFLFASSLCLTSSKMSCDPFLAFNKFLLNCLLAALSVLSFSRCDNCSDIHHMCFTYFLQLFKPVFYFKLMLLSETHYFWVISTYPFPHSMCGKPFYPGRHMKLLWCSCSLYSTMLSGAT